MANLFGLAAKGKQMKPKIKHKILLLIFYLAIFQGLELVAQKKLQVVTKTIQKTYGYAKGDILIVQGEKADVKVTGSDANEIEVTIKLISKALSRDVAIKELEQAKYVSEKKKQELNLKNYFVKHRDKENFEAVLSASFEIKIPKQMELRVTSRYGLIDLSFLTGIINLDTKYCKLKLSDLDVRGIVKGYFGDLNMSNIEGNSSFDLKHVKTEIKGRSEGVSINTNLGDVKIQNFSVIDRLEINGIKSDITVEGVTLETYFFDLETEFGKVYLPDQPKNNSQLSAWKYGDESKPKIQLKTKFGDIKLR